MVVEECSLQDLRTYAYTGIQSKHLSARLGEVAAFSTCIRFVAEQPETVGWKAIRCIIY